MNTDELDILPEELEDRREKSESIAFLQPLIGLYVDLIFTVALL